MNEWERLRRQAEYYKKVYPPGTRVLLRHMGNDPCPVDDNTRGTVDLVDDIGSIHCTFDNGRTLGLIPGEDSFRKLTEAELTEEQKVRQEQESFATKLQSAQTRSGVDAAYTESPKVKMELEH